jgi:glutamine synthetase
MEKIILEYIWLDNDLDIRSKTRVLTMTNISNQDIYETLLTDITQIPLWTFDGSSTNQTSITNTDVVLKPIRTFLNPFINGLLVLSDVYIYTDNGKLIPHPKNNRTKLVEYMDIIDNQELVLSIKQYYYILDFSGKPYGFIKEPKQGKLYCGNKNSNITTRSFAEEHLKLCLKSGLTITNINAEIGPSQWRFIIGPLKGISACDELWIARFILYRLAEKSNIIIYMEPILLGTEYPGSGCHITVSTKNTRQPETGYTEILKLIETLSLNHKKFLGFCGTNTHMRLLGTNDTSIYNIFSSGISTRNTSIRIPKNTWINQSGYFEERRPSANCDPYQIIIDYCLTLFK